MPKYLAIIKLETIATKFRGRRSSIRQIRNCGERRCRTTNAFLSCSFANSRLPTSVGLLVRAREFPLTGTILLRRETFHASNGI